MPTSLYVIGSADQTPRSTSARLTCVARRSGERHAATAESAINATAIANTSLLFALTPKSSALTADPPHHAPTAPSALPPKNHDSRAAENQPEHVDPGRTKRQTNPKLVRRLGDR
jgi:hypothetical protein